MLCRNCGSIIPALHKVDNKVLYVSKSRRNCFNCVPYRPGRPESPLDASPKPCVRCGNIHTKRGRFCSTCAVTIWRKKTKIKSIEYLGGKCVDCGFNSCIAAMEFHHLDPSQKDFNIAGHGNKKAWKSLAAELDKCVLLCATCHRVRHHSDEDIDKYF